MKAARAAWFDQFAGVRVNQLVFIDEFGATTNMQRTHGRAPPGERVVAKVPHGHWKILSTIAAMSAAGIIVSASFDGATDTELFVTFIRECLVPVLASGQVVVMDKSGPAPMRRGGQADRRCRCAGAAAAALFARLQSDRAGDLQDQDGAAQAGAAQRGGVI